MIVEISGGALATYAESNMHVESLSIRHPVLWDAGNRNHMNYGIHSWPAAYLIGADGIVFWQGNPARMQGKPEELAALRKRLVQHLDKARPAQK